MNGSPMKAYGLRCRGRCLEVSLAITLVAVATSEAKTEVLAPLEFASLSLPFILCP
jgi:hypothetical protein